MANINHKSGDTFQLDFTLEANEAAVDITNFDIRAQARNAAGTLILEWNETNSGVNVTNASGGLFNFKSEATYTSTPTGQLATESWPLGVMNVDVEFTDTSATPDSVSSSETFTITVLEDITRD